MRDLARTNSICPKPEDLLLDSIKNNHTDTIRTLITSNPSLLSYKDPYTLKPIVAIACSEEGTEAETVKTLIELGADLEESPEWNPLHLAAQNPNSSILEAIINSLKPGQINHILEGNTALHSLVKCSGVKQKEKDFCKNVQLLIKAGLDVNKADGKNLSAVLWAAKNSYKSIVETILESSICHVDLDTHKLRNKTARDFIKENRLYSGPLPEPIRYLNQKDHIFALVKSGEEEQILQFFAQSQNSLLDSDDGNLTLLQYACKRGLAKAAKYLVENGSDVNKTVKSERTAFEIATDNGYYEIVELFLHQDVQIGPDMICDLVKHWDSPKFPKIDYEKCCNVVLKMVEMKQLDVNKVDALGNPPLHYSLRYAPESISERLLKLGASLATKNDFGVMPIADIKPELLERHLDDCVRFSTQDKNVEKRDFEVILDYKTLMPPRNDKRKCDPEDLGSNESVLETEVIAYMSKAPEFRQLLSHPVIVSFLLIKWHRIRLLFYSNLIFYIAFVVSLITYIFTYYTIEQAQAFATASWLLLNSTFWILVLREIFQIIVSPRKYLKNFENLVEVILIVITGMILYMQNASNDTKKQLASVAILLAAFELLLMFGQHPKLSTNVVMLKTVSLNFFKLLLWYSLLIAAFALSFYILFANNEVESQNNSTSDSNQFMGPGKSLFKTIVMLTGEFDAGSINFQTYPITSKLIFSLFVFMITIILLNLLNGLAVSDTQAIKNDAELVGHIARAQHIYYVESMLHGNILPTTFMKLVQNLFCCFPADKNTTYTVLKPLGRARRIGVFNNTDDRRLIVLPNEFGRIDFESAKRKSSCYKNCSDLYLERETVKRILAIVKLKRNLQDSFCLDDKHKLYAEILALKTKIDLILNCISKETL